MSGIGVGLSMIPRRSILGCLGARASRYIGKFMFTRSASETPDMAEQGALLNQVSRLVDEGVLQTTLADNFGPINAHNLKRAHMLIESGRAKGKIVLEGFEPAGAEVGNQSLAPEKV